MTASELEAALAILRQANLGTAAASLVANERQAAVALRNRILCGPGLPPASRLSVAHNRYRSTTWERTRREVQNPHREGLEAVLWEVLMLVDKNITERHMRNILHRK